MRLAASTGIDYKLRVLFERCPVHLKKLGYTENTGAASCHIMIVLQKHSTYSCH